MVGRFGIFGDTQVTLADNGFFLWFHLRPAEPGPPGETIYRPSSDSFGPLVSLTARLDGENIAFLRLSILRRFIDDPRQGSFARDIAKSFLGGVDGKAGRLDGLINEIFHRQLSSPIIMRGAPPNLPAKASPGFKVFAGERPTWRTNLGDLSLVLRNTQAVDEPALLIEAAPPGANGRIHWLGRLLRGS